MKVALFERPHALNLRSKDIRSLRPDEVLVKVSACGICGTDVHIVEGMSRSTPPVVLGHEYAGVVEECGTQVTGYAPGTAVAVDPNISCGRCFYCQRGLAHLCEDLRALGVDIDGGMAEYSLVPQSQLYEIPADLPTEARAFIEPVSCAIHGIDRARISSGDSVAIVGGGTIGLLMLQLARSAGASNFIVIEPAEERKQIARVLGADHIVDPKDAGAAINDLTGVGADVVIECVGKPQTMQVALALARRGGTVEFFGVCPIGETIPVEPNNVYFRELTIVGSYINPRTFTRSIAMLRSGGVRVDRFKIDRFPLDGVHEALKCQREGTTIKSIIEPNA